MAAEWRNWAGDQACTPAAFERPAGVDEVAEAVARSEQVRVAGAGHSFTDAVLTDGTLLSLDRMDRVLDVDRASGLVRVEAGITLGALSDELWKHGLAFENLGDIDVQSIAGATATGTHGTGSKLPQPVGRAALDRAGDRPTDRSLEVNEESDPDAWRAARVSVGALGVVTAVTLQTVPAFTLEGLDVGRPLDEVLENIDELADGSEHFEFFTFPYSPLALTRTNRRVPGPPRPRRPRLAWLEDEVIKNGFFGLMCRAGRARPALIPRINRLVSRLGGMESRLVDRSYRIFATPRSVRFTEMEYAIPREHAVEAIRAVRALVEERELAVGFPFEVRFVAPDDAFLSPAGGRETCLHRLARVRGDGVRAVHARRRGDHGRLRRAARTGASATSRPPRRCARATPSGTASPRCASGSTPRAASPTSTCGACSGRPCPRAQPLDPPARAVPGAARTLPHVALGEGPTPVRPLTGLRDGLWVKDESAYGTAWGGNKVRKLEWILPDAKRRGKRTILTFGALGTNHGLATALYAREQGLRCAIALVDQPMDDHVRAQLERLRASGATLHFTHTKARTVAAAPWLLARHRLPYVLPAGGSSPVGALGYVEGALELAEQVTRRRAAGAVARGVRGRVGRHRGRAAARPADRRAADEGARRGGERHAEARPRHAHAAGRAGRRGCFASAAPTCRTPSPATLIVTRDFLGPGLRPPHAGVRARAATRAEARAWSSIRSTPRRRWRAAALGALRIAQHGGSAASILAHARPRVSGAASRCRRSDGRPGRSKRAFTA